jgi:hypothetical protein
VEQVTDGYVLDVEDFRTPTRRTCSRAAGRRTAPGTRGTCSARAGLLHAGRDGRRPHAFWSHFDPEHHKFGSPFEGAMLDYTNVDTQLGGCSRSVRRTLVLVVS